MTTKQRLDRYIEAVKGGRAITAAIVSHVNGTDGMDRWGESNVPGQRLPIATAIWRVTRAPALVLFAARALYDELGAGGAA